MASENFRTQLREELEQWLAEGLIDEQLYEQLANRYQLSELDSSARNSFVMILLGLGSVLLGLGVITLVAANWQVWAPEFKVFLLMSLFVVVNTAGFYLWRSKTENWQSRFGRGLLLLGSLIFGANLALMSQTFNLSKPVYELYSVWSLGVLAMAYSLRMTMLGIVSIILLGIAYIWALPDLFSPWEFSFFTLALQHSPLLATFLFIPLAYWCQSAWLFGLAAIFVISSLEGNLLIVQSDFYSYSRTIGAIILALAYSLPPALFWGYDDSLLLGFPSFKPIARNLAVLFLSFIFYIFSFNVFWDDTLSTTVAQVSWQQWLSLVDIVTLVGLTIWFWWRLGYQSRWRLDFTSIAVGVAIAITAGIVFWHLRISVLGGFAVFIFNLFLFMLAIGLVREALTTRIRGSFWWGMVLLVLQLLSRMLEYDTDLLFKAVVLFICGMGIIAAGLWFERYVRL